MEILVCNRQRTIPLDVGWLRDFARLALDGVLRAPAASPGIPDLPEVVEVTIVSDRVIARVHRDFMDIPGATDVITFDHGEIVISAETGRRHAAEHGQPILHEIGRYILHGLLHLRGYDDHATAHRRRMHALQERLLRTCARRMPRA